MLPYVSHIVEVFWNIKVNKYGVLRVQQSRNHRNVPSNNKTKILLDQNETNMKQNNSRSFKTYYLIIILFIKIAQFCSTALSPDH